MERAIQKTIPLFRVFMSDRAVDTVQDTLLSGYIGEGQKVRAFEQRLAGRAENPYTLALNSGTSAIHLALRLAGVGKDDEVITTAMTSVATNVPILERGARIRWADIDPWTGNIDPVDVEKKITGKTRAVIAVDWGGFPARLDAISHICRRHGIPFIEDACQAFGAVYKGKPVGKWADYTCFSFQAVKIMTTVDGGALCLSEKENYLRAKRLRWYGIDRDLARGELRDAMDIPEHGYKFHMNDVTAALGIEQLAHVDRLLLAHRANAGRYMDAFSGLTHIRPLGYRDTSSGNFWFFTIRTPYREKFCRSMEAAGIRVSQVHTRNDIHSMFSGFSCPLPGVDEFTKEQVAIPCGHWLLEEDLCRIIDSVCRFDQNAGKA